jgi:Asp-tRNA(Asn)/Glu-tRNA(Gln) amidotransferase C subunit
MNNKKLQEFKDDAESDKAVGSVVSSLKNILKYVNNKQDFSRVMESLMKWMIRNKQQLNTVETDSNFKQIIGYLNKMQSDTAKKPEQTVTKK